MSNYVLNSKTRYKSLSQWPIRLIEYMIFTNTNQAFKTLVLKMHNRTFETLSEIKIKIRQYDKQGTIIGNADYLFEDLNVGSNEHFTPSKKIKISEACDAIDFELLSASTSEDTWQDGAWKKGTIKKQEEKKTRNITTIDHKRLPFPYFISLGVLAVFAFAVIAVFNALNS